MNIKSKTKADVTGEQIGKLCERHFNMPYERYDELKDGYYNRAFLVRLHDGREVVLKIAPPADVDILTYEKKIMESEVAFYTLAGDSTDVPLPEILSHDFHCTDIPYPCYFMSKLTGIPLNKAGSVSPSMRQKVYTQKAAFLAGIHDIKGDVFGYISMRNECLGKPYFDCFMHSFLTLLNDGHRYGTGFPIPENELLNLLEACRAAFNVITIPSLVHFDLWDGNIFVQSSTDMTITGIVDFERGFYADPAADFCHVAGYIDLDTDSYFFDTYNTYAERPIRWDNVMKIRVYAYRLYLLCIMHVECFYRDIDGSFQDQKKWVSEETPKVRLELQRALWG